MSQGERNGVMDAGAAAGSAEGEMLRLQRNKNRRVPAA